MHVLSLRKLEKWSLQSYSLELITKQTTWTAIYVLHIGMYKSIRNLALNRFEYKRY
jgi:hypothetical protein